VISYGEEGEEGDETQEVWEEKVIFLPWQNSPK
jgi:hypothetical protein